MAKGTTIPTGTKRRHIAIMKAKRQARALDLLNDGLTYEEVSAEIQVEFQLPRYDRAAAWKDCAALIKEIGAKPARQYAADHNIEYLHLKKTFRPLARAGDVKAAALLLKVLEQEAKLNGMNAPIRTQIEITAHFEALAQSAVNALNAGMDAVADLTAEQRNAMIAACLAYLGGIESGGQSDPARVIIDHDPVLQLTE